MYSGKVALVTGGAAGIGRAAALAFAREGACVTVADRDSAGGEAVVKKIIEAGGRAIFVETDVSSEAAIKNMVEKTVAEFGGLVAACNNGRTMGGFTAATGCTVEESESTIRTNMSTD